MHQEKLKKLHETLASQDVTKLSEGTSLFQGADIIISDDPSCPDSNGWSDYTKVVTPFARELSWLVFQLRDIFANELDYMNKYYFYGTLADRANACIEEGRSDKEALLQAVLAAAEEIEL